MITLFVDGHFVSPLDATIIVALDEKGAEYHTARALLRDGQGIPPSLGQRTHIARVPALQHGEFYLSESLAIIDYIEEIFPPPSPRLFPVGLHERARARQVMSYVRCDLHQLREERPWWTVIYPSEPMGELSQRARCEADELLSIATHILPDLGEYSIAHVDLAFQLMRLTRNGHDVPASISQFVETTLARPSVRRYFERPRPPNPPARTLGRG